MKYEHALKLIERVMKKNLMENILHCTKRHKIKPRIYQWRLLVIPDKLEKQRKIAIHDFRFPGYRYENSLSDSDHFLVLIFDANGILCGAQVALPKALANPRFKYENNPYYVEGTYDGNNAFL